MKRNFYLGIDIGGTKMAAAVVNREGEILHYAKRATPFRASSSAVFAELLKLIVNLIKDSGLPISAIKGIGVGIPGIVNPNHRDILRTPNINLAGYPLAKKLQKAFRVKVVFGNDVNLGLLGEHWLGIARQGINVVGIFPGTGVGGAIILQGKLVEGTQGAAAELGHMILDLNSKKKSAGLTGTLEALVGRRSIERDILDAIRKGRKTIITDIVGKNPKVIKSGVLAEALQKNDKVVTEIMNQVCSVLGKACISIRHILNPDMIVMGGGLIEACGGYILPRVQKISDANPFLKGIDQCKIVQSLLGDEAVILGAVGLLRQSLGEKVISKKDYYPKLKFVGNKIIVDGKSYKKNFYIRPDGKVKKINGEFFKDFAGFREVKVDSLKKICRRVPAVLLIGSPKKPIRISAEGRQFLKEKSVRCDIMTLPEAVRVYNMTQERKALIA